MVDGPAPVPAGFQRRRTVEAIVVRAPLIQGETRCGEVVQRFAATGLPAYGIALGNGALGYLDRTTVTAIFARRFGRELHERRPIAEIADRNPFVADPFSNVADVSVQLALEKPEALHTGFLIAHDGAYVGVATGNDLMRAVAEEAAETLEALRQAQTDLVEAEKLASLGGIVAGVAHEINTPLGVALTAATSFEHEIEELYRAYEAGQLKRSDLHTFIENAAEGISLVSVNLRRAAELVASFKQIAVDRASDERRVFNLGDYVRDVIASLRPRYKHRPIVIDVVIDPDIEVDGHPGALAQIITNLLMNALIHAFEDTAPGTVTIGGRRDADTIVLDFHDNGRGIPEALHTRVFDPFFTTERGRGGTGLGLGIVKNLVSGVLGGTIALDSASGRGTRFTIRFPRIVPEVPRVG